MSNLLNLDAVAAEEERVLKFKGGEYPMQPVSVGEFIRLMREAERLEKEGEKASVADQMAAMMKSIAACFPTMPQEVLDSMSFKQLSAVFEFIRNDPVAEAQEGKSGKK